MPFKSKAQQRFMYATMPKTAEKWSKETPNIKSLPQHVKNEEVEHVHPGCEDKIGKIFVVMKPTPGQSAQDVVHPSHAFGMAEFNPNDVHGIYNDEAEANLVAEAACNEMYKQMAKVEKKKDHVISEIDKHITRLQKEINAHMKEATEKPEESEMHHQLAERKMNIIKRLRDKHKTVKSAKREVPKPEEK